MQKKQRERTLDTRRKIQMGGLVITAGADFLFDINETILLGALMDIATKAKTNDKIIDKWQQAGIEYFKSKKENTE